MANLPNINSANVGIIAFWNAHDHPVTGSPTIDPLDCTSIFTSYDVYDNGITGTKAFIRELEYSSITNARTFNLRVKNDGWMIAWIDRTNTFSHPNTTLSDFGDSGTIKGYYDIMYDWLALKTNLNASYTVLSHLISTLYNSLSNKASFTFSVSDVGHYCYEFINANVYTLTSIDETNGAGSTGQIQYTAGTTLYYVAAVAAAYGPSGHTSKAKFADNTLVDITSSYRAASANLITEGWMPNPSTNYSIYVLGDVWSAKNSILVLWS